MIYFLINFVIIIIIFYYECEFEKKIIKKENYIILFIIQYCLYNINKCRFLFTFINIIVNFFFV